MRNGVSPCKVFLNFRGEQVRYNFVSHLSDALKRQEMEFFIDNNEQRGKDLKDLFVRIKESRIALAIFSTGYAESSWCLDELVKMKKLADKEKLQVIPIFYKVKARDVREQTGLFGDKFWALAKGSTGDQLRNWKEALESISTKMGLSLGEKSSESDFVYQIVEVVKSVKDEIELQEADKLFWVRKLKRKARNLDNRFRIYIIRKVGDSQVEE